MTRACHAAVRMATGDVFNDAEIDDMLDRLAKRAARAGKDAPELSRKAAIAQAMRDMTRDELFASLQAKRVAVASEVAEFKRRSRIDAMPAKMTPAQRLSAYDVGSEVQGRGTSSSVDAEGRARQMMLWGQVDIALSKMPGLKNRISNFWGISKREVELKIATEMARLTGGPGIEPTGDEGALHAAQALVAAQEQGRLMQNAQGAWIAKLPGYIARQSHSAEKVAGNLWRELGMLARNTVTDKKIDWAAAQRDAGRRAFRVWRDDQLRWLHDDTFKGLTEADVPFEHWEDDAEEAAQLGRRAGLKDAQGLAMRGIIDDPTSLRERMLYHTWFNIVTGAHETLTGADDAADFRPPPGRAGSKAASVSASRTFIYKDPESWLNYNDKYGNGSLFNSIMNGLGRSARNAALMERWGPNPDAARAAEIDRLTTQARNGGDTKTAMKLQSSRQTAEFDALNSRLDRPDNMRLAGVMRTIRSYEALTKLGSIVLSKATDLPISGQTMARAGGGYLAGYEGALKGILRLGSEDAKAAGDALYVGARHAAGHLGGQYLASDGAAGWTMWATRLMYKLNQFDFVTDGVRQGMAQMYSRVLGQQADRRWDALEAGTRETFERFGLTPRDWDIVRRGLEPAGDGRTYFTLDHLERIPEKALSNSARADLQLKFMTMIHNVLDDCVSEPRLREKVTSTWNGARAGTLLGEVARSFFQFKGFINAIVGRHMVPAMKGFAGYKPVETMSHFIIGGALAGFLSMNAKLIAGGKLPRSPIGDTPQETAKIWMAALAQGGGFGMYGDFLFGEQARSGKSFSLSAMGGPMLSDAEQLAQIVQQAVTGGDIDPRTGRSPLPAELVRLGKSNIPLVNLWYTRLALDYFVLWRLQEAVSPGYLRRYEQRAAHDGTRFIIPPSAAAGGGS